MLLPDFPRHARALSGLAFGMLGSIAAHAQTVNAPPLVLRPSSLLQETITDDTRKQLPTFLQSDALSGQTDLQTTLEGHVTIRRGDILLKADKVEYDQVRDFAKARGNVTINRAGNVYQGPALDIQLDAFEGFFTQPNYQLLKNKAHGKAERIDFIDSANTVLHKADFTTCQRKPGPSWTPDWFFKGDKITLDTDRNIGLAEGASLRFKEVPILPVPNVDFPLSDERKSGLLPPTIGVDNIGGLEYTQPYYWNLAPNRDLTFFPTYWSKRGLRLGTEFRYLEGAAPNPAFQGEMRFSYMEKDNLRGMPRWDLQYKHTGLMDPRFAGGGLSLNLNVNRVSDNDYWRDFNRNTGALTSRLLPNDATLSWGQGPVSLQARVLKWQTLQDPTAIITPPYDRSPQIVLRHNRWDVQGLDYSTTADTTRFETDYSRIPGGTTALLRNGQRSYVSSQVSMPFVNPWGFLTPKLQVHATRYQLDNPLSDGRSSVNRVLPTFSLDAGVVLERDANVWGRAVRQTLEPRAFYLRTPYTDQSMLPLYDTGATDFNLTTIYSENPYVGQDRIADNNLVTLGVNSRFFDATTGAELARFGFAQRFRFHVSVFSGIPKLIDCLLFIRFHDEINPNKNKRNTQ